MWHGLNGPLLWQPAAPPLHLLGGALLVGALAIFAYWRNCRERPWAGGILCAMRLIFIAAVTLLLMGPSRVRTQSQTQTRPQLTILLDTSASMQTTDASGIARLDLARQNWLSDDRLNQLEKEFSLELLGFDEKPLPLPRSDLSRPAPELATGRSTMLARSVEETLSRMRGGQDGSALLLLSDGRDSEEAAMQPAADLARSRDIPVYSALIGHNVPRSDAAIVAVPMQDDLLPGESGAILVKVFQSGLGSAATELRVRTGTTERTVPVAFRGKPVVELQIPVKHDEPGQHEYTLTLAALPDEVTTTNNQTSVFCDVQRKRIRVLLIEGSPYWDTKFLAQALRKDERIELVQISQVTKRKRETIVTRGDAGVIQLPASLDEWGQYDVVILGRGLEQVLTSSSADQLAEFVAARGGHLVFARGPAVSRTAPKPMQDCLDRISPVLWGNPEAVDAKLALTGAGRVNPWLTSTRLGVNVERALLELPGFETVCVQAAEKPSAIVLARAVLAGKAGAARQPPALAQMTLGRGSVLAITGEGLWRWSLMDDSRKDLVGLYDAFWSNLVRWMSMGGDFPPGEQTSLKLSRTTSRLGDRLTVDVACRNALPGNALPSLTVSDRDGRMEQIVLERKPGREPRFQARLTPSAVGIYRVQLRTPGLLPPEQEKWFSVYDVHEERLNTEVNPAALKQLAEQTNGAFFEVDQFDAFHERLKRYHLFQATPPTPEFLWDDWRVMVALLVWIGTEWIARRQLGLL